MTYFNPLIAPAALGQQAQRAAADKGSQVARAQALSKNTAAEGDRFEHQVESADGLAAVGDDPSKGGQPRQQRQRRREDGTDDDVPGEPPPPPPHIDITG